MNMSEQNTIKDGGEPNILSRILGWVSHRFLPRTAASGLFMDALSCLLLSAATLAFLLAPTGLKNALPIHFAASAVLSCLIALVSRRWWIFPCAAGGGVLIYAAVHLIAGSLPGQIEYWGGFIDWAASGAAVEPGVTDLSFPVVLYVLAALAVTAVMFVLIRTLFSLSSIVFGLLAALQIGAFILSCVLVYSDLTGAVCVSAAGMIMLLPRVYAKRLAGTAKRGGVSRSHMQAVAVFTATLSVIIALIITPKDTGVWQSRRLNYWLYDLNTLAGDPLRIWRTTGNESSSDFGLRRVTFQSETGRLGGPITLDDELYLIVTSSRPVLLRGQVKDQYTGRSWRASVGRTEDYRLASPLWNDLRRETFDQNKPIGGEEARGIYRRLTAEVEVTARKTSNTSNVLFVPGSMQTAALRNSSATEILFNKRSELYLPAFLPNMRYTVTSRVWNIGTPNFEELFLRLEELVCRENEGYADKSYPAIAERYTQLPEGLPPEVRAAADDITKGIDSPFLKARAISRWLAANAEYTLTPDMPPDGEDFVAHFLETREGYCVYYASAMAVLARCADLPARYVTGFALKYDAESGDYHATGKTAHAWSEVYFEGIGWFPIDPLGWNSQAPLNEDAPSDVSASALPSSSDVSQSEIQPEEQPQSNGGAGHRERASVWLPLLFIFTISSLVFAWALFFGPGYMNRRWSYEAVSRRLGPDTGGRLDAVYRDVLRLLGLHGLAVQPGETLVTFPGRVDRLINFDGITLSETAGAVMRMHFGGRSPDDGEIARACLYHRQLEALTLESLGKLKYAYKRLLPTILLPQK